MSYRHSVRRRRIRQCASAHFDCGNNSYVARPHSHRLRSSARSLVWNRFRWPQSAQILRIECAQRCLDRITETDDTISDAGSEKGNPNTAAARQLWTSHCAWTSRIGRAVKLHSLHCRSGFIDARLVRRRTGAARELQTASLRCLHA